MNEKEKKKKEKLNLIKRVFGIIKSSAKAIVENTKAVFNRVLTSFKSLAIIKNIIEIAKIKIIRKIKKEEYKRDSLQNDKKQTQDIQRREQNKLKKVQKEKEKALRSNIGGVIKDTSQSIKHTVKAGKHSFDSAKKTIEVFKMVNSMIKKGLLKGLTGAKTEKTDKNTKKPTTIQKEKDTSRNL